MSSQLTTMLVGEGAKLDVHGCKTVDMASSFGKVFPGRVPARTLAAFGDAVASASADCAGPWAY